MKRLTIILSVIAVFFLISGCSNSVGNENEPPGITMINFAIPETTHVKLWVENAYQTTVRVLVDEEREAGVYSVPLEMIDENGDRLPKGAYTYYIEIDDESLSRHLIYQ